VLLGGCHLGFQEDLLADFFPAFIFLPARNSALYKATPSGSLVSGPPPASFFGKLKFGHYHSICIAHAPTVVRWNQWFGSLCTIVNMHNGRPHPILGEQNYHLEWPKRFSSSDPSPSSSSSYSATVAHPYSNLSAINQKLKVLP
jgi:hypothetical protein